MKNTKLLAVAAAAVASFAAPMTASAAPIKVYLGPDIDFSSTTTQLACIQYLDGVGCSAPLLNRLAGKADSTKDDAGGYVVTSPQGELQKAVTIITGGQAAVPNNDTDPTNPPVATGSRVENGFKSNSNDPYQSTGKASGTSSTSVQTDIAAGNLPADNGNSLAQLDGVTPANKTGTWDVGLDWLIKALTYDKNGTSVRGQLMIGFDYNNPQSASPENSLSYWSLITVRDTAGALPDLNFEFRATGTQQVIFPAKGATPAETVTVGDGVPLISQAAQGGFVQDNTTTRRTWDEKPLWSDFSSVNLVTCYRPATDPLGLSILPLIGGTCPGGYEELYNAKGNESTEILGFVPVLSANLETIWARGMTSPTAHREAETAKAHRG